MGQQRSKIIKWFVIASFVLGTGYVIAHDPGKEQWEAVGPKWACMLNPAKYDFCNE